MKNREEWILRLEAMNFIPVKKGLWVNSFMAGWPITIEPFHPSYKSWSQIRKDIEEQLK